MTQSISNPISQNNLIHSHPQPWLVNGLWESWLILAPPFISVLLTIILSNSPLADPFQTEMPIWFWVVCILMVDVAHVYSTLFQTYFKPDELKGHPLRYTLIPIFSFLSGCLLHSLSASLFWTLLAYLAVFHFVRQQYGLMALYKRKDPAAETSFKKWGDTLDALLIYATMLYPLIYWHTHLPRQFSWFMPGDFLTGLPLWAEPLSGWIYGVLILVYWVKEWLVYRETGWLNLPKNLIILGTALTWYTGIVLLNGDMAFTLTNVLSHGIPYMGLIWLLQHRDHFQHSNNSILPNQQTKTVLAGVMALFLLWALAFTEEAFWDGWVWQEHQSVFDWLPFLNAILPDQPLNMSALSWVVPLLATPQITHYLLDGFIWRKSEASQMLSD
jgi:hypothetical protein